MAERKNTQFDRPGGYAMPKGATQVQRKAAAELEAAYKAGQIKLLGDCVAPYQPNTGASGQSKATRGGRSRLLKPAFCADDPDTRLYVGDCRDILAQLPDKGSVDLIFADPPFNWDVPYAGDSSEHVAAAAIESAADTGRKKQAGKAKAASASSSVAAKSNGSTGNGGWNDRMPRREYERFTFDWLDACIDCLAPHGSIFVNIPDDTAAECVIHLKRRGLTMINWCIWHFRFGQNRSSSFIMSKVHVLYFAKNLDDRIWNPNDILELSDRASIYGDPRTMAKNENKGLRVPMDVWYGKYWGRIQGNNKERRHNHHNQIPEIYLERVIKACSNPGDLVLDPFCGSGTTSTVARALGRRSITCEYSKVNAASAWERITKIGMIKRDDDGPQSTAIFEKRRKIQPVITG